MIAAKISNWSRMLGADERDGARAGRSLALHGGVLQGAGALGNLILPW